ncbi:efflux RND transporter periplasmic adaptor subunit [Paenibacillus sp. GP183]|jgi:multidrug resistance efflux pump|uniref:HlyD family secretion protein n=1 Tax=Paenibacillus sp. GP183 TaxID=1882751 RepID=UPI00089733C7|nr:efflux RND transporter periplasmic adaptor subunit [Paenibacillus sp. GP183]SEC26143.1 Barrel-sandwich domain of CusB or HlyD membrane-fusion [Paenibacillus sp. GP183]
MKSGTRLVLLNVVLLIILVGGAIVGYYYYNRSVTYLSTNNARVDGQQIMISSMVPGRLSAWTADAGKKFAMSDVLGRVVSATGGVDITMPQPATIVQQNAVVNMNVAPGVPLAYAYDLDRLWVSANIQETDFNAVKIGQAVDVYVDAFSGTALSGKVDRIGLAAASIFSLMPSSNATGNYTKVTQVIPIVVSLDGYRGLSLVPGMSATIRIHR